MWDGGLVGVVGFAEGSLEGLLPFSQFLELLGLFGEDLAEVGQEFFLVGDLRLQGDEPFLVCGRAHWGVIIQPARRANAVGCSASRPAFLSSGCSSAVQVVRCPGR